MARLLLTLRFDGTRYCGWQVQPNGVSVQSRIQDAVERITGVRSGVTGCSRTDAGVHAEMFCCTVDTGSALRGDKLTAALNAVLPRDIAVTGAREVPPSFHPRYDAVAKRYVYRIWNGRARNPFWEGRAWHITLPLPQEKLNGAAADFVGKRNFAAFCASGSRVTETERTVMSARVVRDGDLVSFEVEADGFLYHMVRIMTGTLAEMAFGRLPYDAVPGIIASRSRERAGMTAPAHGLYLQSVMYDNR